MLAGLLTLGVGRSVAAKPPVSLRDGVWTWGYVIPGKIPAAVPFVFPGESSCSLETAATYLGKPNVVLMNSQWSTPGHLERLTHCKRVLCAISVRDPAEAARLSAFSKRHANIVGAMIDDFYPVQEKLTVEQVKALSTALKSENPAMKLYVVRYTHSKDEELLPYLPYIDVINLWVWKGNKEEWLAKMDDRIAKLAALTHKPIVLGLYLHDYGAAAARQNAEGGVELDEAAGVGYSRGAVRQDGRIVRTAKSKALSFCKTAGWIARPTGPRSNGPRTTWTGCFKRKPFETERLCNSPAICMARIFAGLKSLLPKALMFGRVL